MRKIVYLMTLLLTFVFVLDASAQKKKKKKSKEDTAAVKSETAKGADKNGMKPYNKVITKEAESDDGLFTVHKIKDKYYYEIADTLLGREMLMVTRIAKTATGISFGGNIKDEQVLRWVRQDSNVLLRVVSYDIYAADSLPIHEAVVNSNFEPVLFSFPIKALSKDSAGVVIEATPLYTKDVKPLGFPANRRSRYKITRLEADKSYIERISSYPLNIETRHVKTYVASAPPSNRSTGLVSVEMSNSMILLPKVPMRRRYFDQRVGWFDSEQVDYGLKVQKSKTLRYLNRWRLEIKDEDIEKFNRGELVEPKKPIVYYVDRATPEEWVPFIKQGIEDWQVAFETAGFKNAIIAMDPPSPKEDPDWSPEDVRYSVVRYLASPVQNASGPHVNDPRSGEILESDINWYHNVMSLLRNWFFIQTSAINPDAQSVEFRTEVMGRLIRFVSSHEVGHTLGLPHNMGSSVAYPVDSLRSATFTQKFGTAPSIMDYARFNYVAQPGDEGVALMPNIGPYDKYAIKWGYRPLPEAATANDEKKTLDSWILEKQDDPMYRFGSQQSGSPIDPSSQTEDLGDNAIKASEYGISNLKIIVPKLNEWTAEDGKDYSDLETMYGQVLSQYNRYMGHVTANIGGVYEYYKTYDQEGAVYIHVPEAHQKACMKFINDQLFSTPGWLIEKEIFNKIEFAGSVERIRGYQVRTLDNILDFGRLARVIENETLNGRSAYSMLELMYDLRKGIWAELPRGRTIDTYRRNLQKAYIARMEYLMTEEQESIPAAWRSWIKRTNVDVVQSDIRSVARAELRTLKTEVQNAIPRTSDRMSKYHLQDVVVRIDNILDPK